MHLLPTPTQTSMARQRLKQPDATLDRIQRALLATVDGHRNVIELESVARAMGLEPSALERLRQQGLTAISASLNVPATEAAPSIGRRRA